MSCWNKEQLENMLEDVVNELDLSAEMIEKHGQLGTAPSELVKLVLMEKNLRIRMLSMGMKDISDGEIYAKISWLDDVKDKVRKETEQRVAREIFDVWDKTNWEEWKAYVASHNEV
jgi:hypothetical protein